MRLRATQMRPGGGLKPLAAIIRDLFASGEQGVWYDPSDLTTLFQDAAGTIPVTAVEQPVGLMLDKSKGLVLGAELVTNGDLSQGLTGWTAHNAVVSNANGTLKVDDSTNLGSNSSAVQQLNLVSGKTYLLTFDVVSVSGTYSIGFASSASAESITFPILSQSTAGPRKLVFTYDGSRNFLFMEVDGTGVVFYDNISIRELPGNHASQTTATSRPVLSARVNLLTYSEQFSNAAWIKQLCSISPNLITAPDGTLTADKVVEDTTSAVHRIEQNATVVAGVSYTISVAAKKAERSFLRLFEDTVGSGAVFDLATGVVSSVVSGTATIKDLGNGWFRCSVTYTQSGTIGRFRIAPQAVATPGAYLGDGVSGIYIWGADFRPANSGTNLPDYQRVNTATDYDTAGFPYYLKFDGTDDWLVTPSINFTSTDKVMVCAGVRKLSDAGIGCVVELSNSFANNRVFMVYAPDGNGTFRYEFGSRGTSPSLANTASTVFNAPTTNVLTGVGDIAGANSVLRINGSEIAKNSANQGTGTYGNYPLYIGRRAGTSLPFNGHLYSLIIRGAAASDSQIKSAEKYINGKTRAF